jgi:hypothetical protein
VISHHRHQRQQQCLVAARPQAAAHAALAQARVTPSLAALADPANHQIGAAAIDYFLIEMVNTLWIVARRNGV